MKHTKKHWTWEEHELSTGYSAVVYDPDGIAIDTHIAAEKAEHIANCMNACADLNPAAIPDVVDALKSLLAAVNTMELAGVIAAHDLASFYNVMASITPAVKALQSIQAQP